MNSDSRRTDLVHRIFDELVSAGATNGITPGDVNARLRDQKLPLGAWEVRGELVELERAGVVVLDADSGRWFPATAAGKRRNTA